jgi:rhamnose utilization protein RhaD (predicted bifunctional aldolase and dehydrogenase)
MSLTIISELSRKYGSNPAYVLAGGGNTSYKDEQYLYVKPSCVALASKAAVISATVVASKAVEVSVTGTSMLVAY